MSSKGLGMTCVVDEGGVLLGIITDGDLRRHMERAAKTLEMTARDIMTEGPVSVLPATLAVEALNLMEQRRITSIVVVDDRASKRVLGVVHLHDLWRTEMF
jgi:arabinose-5-phosphate isomerase